MTGLSFPIVGHSRDVQGGLPLPVDLIQAYRGERLPDVLDRRVEPRGVLRAARVPPGYMNWFRMWFREPLTTHGFQHTKKP